MIQNTSNAECALRKNREAGSFLFSFEEDLRMSFSRTKKADIIIRTYLENEQKEIPCCFFHDINCEKPTQGWHYGDFAVLVQKAQAEGKIQRD